MSWPARVGMVLLIAVTVFVGAVRPLTRPVGHLYRPLGLTRLSLLSEAAVNDDTPLPAPVAGAPVFAPPLAIVPVVWKTQRPSRRSVVLHRPKLPPPSDAGSLLSD